MITTGSENGRIEHARVRQFRPADGSGGLAETSKTNFSLQPREGELLRAFADAVELPGLMFQNEG